MKTKTVIITGGSSGIGATTALMFAKQKVNITITYKKNKIGAEKVKKEIESLGSKVLVIKANLTSDKEAKKVIDQTVKKFGRIDVLVNNAGSYINGDEWDGPSKIWVESLKQNLVSTMSMSKYVTKVFQKQRSGTIINIASTHGLSGHFDSVAYSASKAGVINLTQAYSHLLSQYHGRANSISPSPTKAGYWTSMTKDKKKELKDLLSETKIHRILKPEEIAKKIMFLASDKASKITGENFVINRRHYRKQV